MYRSEVYLEAQFIELTVQLLLYEPYPNDVLQFTLAFNLRNKLSVNQTVGQEVNDQFAKCQ